MSATLEAGGWLAKLVFGVASATVIGGGTMVLSLHRNDAVQDEKIAHISEAVQKMDDLNTKLDYTNREVAVLNERLRAQKEQPDVSRQ
jgi:hypothetical protein